MSLRRLLAILGFVVCCATSSATQLPKRLERCLPNPSLAQEIQDMKVPEPKIYVRVVDVQFDASSRIPQEIQDEISKNEIDQTHEENANSDYLEDAANEISEVRVRGALQNAGFFRALANTKLTVSPREGLKAFVVAHVTADVGDQYRLGKVRFESTEPEKPLAYPFDSLRAKFSLQRGDLFNVDSLREGLKNLTSMYGEDGYIDFTAEPEFNIDDDAKVIDVTFRLDLQKQYRIREVQFLGVSPPVEQQLRTSYQQSGEVFNKHRVEQLLQDNSGRIPKGVELDEVVNIERNAQAGTIGILFDLRTCPAVAGYAPSPNYSSNLDHGDLWTAM